MIPNYLSAAWPSLAPALGNHLWQSTVFVITAGLLTLILRKNHARVRYWLWLAASVKFLIPFSVLVALGNYLSGAHTAAGTNAAFYIAVEEVSQPFTQPTMPVIPQVAASTALTQLLPALLAVVWLCGFLVVIFHWYFRWRRISAAIRKSVPLQEGREVQTLRRLERTGGMRNATEMLLSRTCLEPGVFGITRPVLLWPEGISKRLEDAHLEAILAHELWHVRRRDNLAAATHMVVEAIFWFHPLVWWLGARLLEERERACDEEVLESGSDRQVYAESILKICEFCVGSPLACVSGVTGADLKKRMAYIMTKNLSRKLDFSRKLLLSVAGLLAVAAPIVFGLLHATQTRAQSRGQNAGSSTPAYEAASIKLNQAGTDSLKTGNGIIMQNIMFTPGTFTAHNISMWELIRNAYRVEDYQVLGAPEWFSSELYDVDAKAEKSVIDEMQKLGNDQRDFQSQRMLQALLTDRFKLKVHRETKNLPIYSLVVAEPGKLHEAPGDCGSHPNPVIVKLGTSSPPPPCGSLRVHTWVGQLDGQKVPITQLVANLSAFTRRMVLDKTNLVGKYDIDLKWFPDSSEFPPRPAYLTSTYQPDPDSPPLLTAIQQQLGLKLEPQTGPVELLVIDHAEKPSDPQAQNTAVIPPVFAVASIKPNNGTPIARFSIVGKPFAGIMWKADRFMATNFTLHKLIQRAYDVQDDQILGGPDWVNSEGYNIDAKVEKSVVDELQRLGPDQRVLQSRRMLQEFLADRFKLSFHSETKEVPVYALVVEKKGLKIQRAIPGDTYPNGFKRTDGVPLGTGDWSQPGKFVGQGVPIAPLVQDLSEHYLHRTILDMTGLTDKYDFALQWTPVESEAAIFTAIQEQLGLKLEPQKGPMQILIIDHAEKPSEN